MTLTHAFLCGLVLNELGILFGIEVAVYRGRA
jgi:hypothetical protein